MVMRCPEVARSSRECATGMPLSGTQTLRSDRHLLRNVRKRSGRGVISRVGTRHKAIHKADVTEGSLSAAIGMKLRPTPAASQSKPQASMAAHLHIKITRLVVRYSRG